MRQAAGGDDFTHGRADRLGERMPLRHIADARMVGRRVCDLSLDLDRPTQPGDEAEESLDEGRLSRAVGAEQGDDLSDAHGQVETVDHDPIVVAEADGARGNEGGAHGQSCPRRRVARLARITPG